MLENEIVIACGQCGYRYRAIVDATQPTYSTLDTAASCPACRSTQTLFICTYPDQGVPVLYADRLGN